MKKSFAVRKIPIDTVVTEALQKLISFKGVLFRGLLVPALLMVSLTYLEHYFLKSGLVITYLSVGLAHLLVWSFFAVVCHRIILSSDESYMYSSIKNIGGREIAFAWCCIELWLIALLLAIPVVFLVFSKVDNLNSQFLTSIIKMASFSPIAYIVARLSLVLPATALDQKTTLHWSWEGTRDNGIRLFILLAVIPFVTGMVYTSVYRDGATLFEELLLDGIYLAVSVFEIFLLSVLGGYRSSI